MLRICNTQHMNFIVSLILLTAVAAHGNMNHRPSGGFRHNVTGMTCTAAEDVCPFGNLTGVERVKVCRTGYHPVTGAEISKSLCIRPERGVASSDGCGCCGSGCPTRPEFQDINCTDDAVNDLVVNPNVAIVCRDVYNPFTGVEEAKTLRIRKNKSLEGDACGCCGGATNCPTPGESRPIFERPAKTNETCEDVGPIDCRRRNRIGFFVCRSITNPLSGVSQDVSVCASEGHAWEGDTCGCCGDDCPATRVDLACDQELETAIPTCNLRNGGEGNFVCRSLFHPFDGELRNRTFCAITENSWVFDSCGCCGDGCPVEPESGFPDEEEQWLALLEEDPFMLEDPSDDLEDDGSTSSATSVPASSILILILFHLGPLLTGMVLLI